VLKIVEQEPGALGVSQLVLVRLHKFPEIVTPRPIEQVLSLVTLGPPSDAIKSVIDATRKFANRDIN
jgi:hypothetical protein